MKIQVLAVREQKIQTEVKEIKKVFYCDLCNKQYKLAMEFEVHLSSYDHNHRKVFCPYLGILLNFIFIHSVVFIFWLKLQLSRMSCSVLKK